MQNGSGANKKAENSTAKKNVKLKNNIAIERRHFIYI